MTKRSRTPMKKLVATLALAVLSGCADATAPKDLATLYVSPITADLSTDATDSVQLSIAAWDQTGFPMPGAGAPTYSSSAPAIAVVNSSGVVRGVAPGTAEITASLTLGGVTRTASMTVKVHTWRTLGSYRLTALITSPDWANLTDARYTASMALELDQATSELRGVLTDWRFVSAGSVEAYGTAMVSGSFANGEILIHLTAGGFSMRGEIGESGDIAGTWAWSTPLESERGTFTATRMPQ